MTKRLSFILFFYFPLLLLAQQKGEVAFKVLGPKSKALYNCFVVFPGAEVGGYSNEKGIFRSPKLNYGTYKVTLSHDDYKTITKEVVLNKALVSVEVKMIKTKVNLKTVVVENEHKTKLASAKMKDIDDVTITAGMKSQEIKTENILANTATNSSRQIYSRVPSLFVWESDGAGIQLGIGGRGLSPSRTANFNTRQNGYDISADALGYPESYYTPPSEALKKIQLIRGAASLQFGTQFGGLLNFVMKEGNKHKPMEVVLRQSLGSFGLKTSFLSLGGTKGTWNYYAYGNYKTGDDWRPNSHFDVYTGGLNITKQLGRATSLKVEVTKMYYLTQQPGGLTDYQFKLDPTVSFRDRNWFRVDWNLGAIELNHTFKNGGRLNSRFFGLVASREALGFLDQINRIDHGEERTLIYGKYMNAGNETRYLKTYDVNGKTCAFLFGIRAYKGYSEGRQGLASNGDGPDFSFINSEVDGSDYKFPSQNYAAFIEHVCNVTKKLSFTPGARYEWIDTRAEGVFRNQILNNAGDVVFDTLLSSYRRNQRGILIAGIGASYKKNQTMEFYGNFSQNYRSINFTDMQIQNPNFRIDPNLEDEKGFNADLGVRGSVNNKIFYDVSGYVLAYNNRIGTTIQVDPEWATTYQYRTNIAKSLTKGVEALVEADLWSLFVSDSSKNSLKVYANLSYTDARYTKSDEAAFENKFVELVPPYMIRTGVNFSRGPFSASYQFSYTAEHFSDATNSESQPNAVTGIIPAYHVSDLALKYTYKWTQIETGINNLTDTKYFTRRATGYPGPGIIPSAPRSYYITLQVKF